MKILDKTLALLGLALAVPLFAGGVVACGGASCQSECERSQKLDCDKDGQPDNGGTVNCATACATYKTLNDASGCGKQFDTFTSCVAGISDLCVNIVGCAAQQAAWSDCSMAFCAANPTNTACQQPA